MYNKYDFSFKKLKGVKVDKLEIKNLYSGEGDELGEETVTRIV